MRLKRKKYSLRNCNPPEKMIRRKINELDFKMKFPFYSFDKNKIDLSLLRRFLYQNDIKSYQLYTQEVIEEQMEERKGLSEKQKKFLAEISFPKKRWQILDIRE